MYQTESSGYIQDKIKADNVMIFEVDDNFHVERSDIEYYNIYEDGYKETNYELDRAEYYGYKFYVPKGTVNKTYEINLK